MSDDYDDLILIQLHLPRAMVAHALAEASRLCEEQGGPPIETPQDGVRAMFLYGLNTAAVQDALAMRMALLERDGKPLDS